MERKRYAGLKPSREITISGVRSILCALFWCALKSSANVRHKIKMAFVDTKTAKRHLRRATRTCFAVVCKASQRATFVRIPHHLFRLPADYPRVILDSRPAVHRHLRRPTCCRSYRQIFLVIFCRRTEACIDDVLDSVLSMEIICLIFILYSRNYRPKDYAESAPFRV
jgi:hypothetical protein